MTVHEINENIASLGCGSTTIFIPRRNWREWMKRIEHVQRYADSDLRGVQ